jgi:hypothetical protein
VLRFRGIASVVSVTMVNFQSGLSIYSHVASEVTSATSEDFRSRLQLIAWRCLSRSKHKKELETAFAICGGDLFCDSSD